jgi:hypothetical protein
VEVNISSNSEAFKTSEIIYQKKFQSLFRPENYVNDSSKSGPSGPYELSEKQSNDAFKGSHLRPEPFDQVVLLGSMIRPQKSE